jgi:ATP-binding cassette subfamily B protein
VWYVTDRLQSRMAHRLGMGASEHLLRLSLGFHTRHDTAEKLGIVDRGLSAAQSILWTVLVQMLPSCCVLAVFIAWTATISPVPALLMVAGSVALVASARRLHRAAYPVRERWRDAGRSANAYNDDVVRNIRMIKSTATEQAVLEEMVRRGEELIGMGDTVMRHMARMHAAQSFVRNLTSGAVLSVGCWQLLRGDITLGTVTLLFGVVQRLTAASQNLSESYASVQRHRPDAESLFALLAVKPDIVVSDRPVPLGEMAGSIAFENVSFAYPDTPGTIRDASFFVPAGKTVAIVGPSGAGKTTIATLALRGFDPHAGCVRVDGKDLRDLDPAEYLRQVAVVPQGNALFNMTVRENITFGLETWTRGRVETAAKMAGAHEFICGLRNGYDTPVGENGVRLSGGQAQRIAIARALMRDPRLLILDEATSHLDAAAESHVLDEVMRNMAGTRTVLVIAHRLSTIACADEVVVVDGGRVVQQGTFDALRAAPGAFRRLVGHQEESVVR